jgi:phage terminase large subunit
MIKFSDKYQPLFELLNANNEIQALLEIPKLNRNGISRLEYLRALKSVDTILVSGGRDSGKTFCLGCVVTVATNENGHRVLYTRQTMSSTDNSITAALENRMEIMGVESDYTFANNNYTCKHNYGKISITGQKTSVGTQTAKLKSLEDYSIFITDEGEELTDYEDWKKIKRSMRAKDVQCLSIISFNPPSKRHWIYQEFYQNVSEGFNGIIDNVLYIHTTYLDNGQENMAEQNWKDYERLRIQYEKYEAIPKSQRELIPRSDRMYKDWREYKTVILGGFRDIAEGVIFDYSIGAFVENPYENTYGADQGFTHASAVIKVNVDRAQKKIYLKQILHKTGQTESQIYEAIKTECGFSRIWCDDAAAMFIKGLKDKGLNIKGAKKPKIKDRILAALDYEIIVDPDSDELIDEFNEYRWSDHKTKEAPVDEKNHGMDAWGYAFYRIINTSIANPGSH